MSLRTPCAPFLLLFASLACGGCTAAPPATRANALRSFVGTVTDVKIQMPTDAASPQVAPISLGEQVRFDLRVDDAGHAELVAMAPYGEAARAEGASTDALTVTSARTLEFHTGPVEWSSRPPGGIRWSTRESYSRFAVQLGGDGTPRAIVATGNADEMQGDWGYGGAATATFALRPDDVAPTWRTHPVPSFASSALPWDALVVEASEPYEGTAAFAALFPGATPSDFDATRLVTVDAWGEPASPRERGVQLVAKRWDARASLVVRGAPIADFAGNPASATALPVEGIALAPPVAPTLAAGGSGGTTWGDAKPASDCGEGKPCVVVGPFFLTPCGASAGGVAARLSGSGRARFRVRITQKLTSAATAGTVTALHLLATNPGTTPVTRPSPLVVHATDATNTRFDSDWTTVDVVAPDPTAHETGVAVGAGGLGDGPSNDWCGRYPGPSNEITVYVGAVSVGP
jgi:hypothetical protein